MVEYLDINCEYLFLSASIYKYLLAKYILRLIILTIDLQFKILWLNFYRDKGILNSKAAELSMLHTVKNGY